MTAPICEVIRQARRNREPMGWRRELALLIRSYAQTKEDGRPLSSRTREEVFTVLFRMFEMLKKAGFRFEPRNLGPRHIEWLRRHYAEQLAAGTIQVSTLQTYWSVLRRFCDETGHRRMVAPVAQLFPEVDTRRVSAAQVDKSWSGNQISFEEVFRRAWDIEPFVAMALMAQCALGLRRREALCLRPHLTDWEAGNIEIVQGAKGGRRRTVMLETQMARDALERLARWVAQRDGALGGSIGPQPDSDGKDDLASNLTRYHKVLSALGVTRAGSGVTGHGLRAQYAIEYLARRGHVVSVRIDAASPLQPLTPQGHADEMSDRAALSQQLGHSRVSVTTAYTGALPARRQPSPPPLDGRIE